MTTKLKLLILVLLLALFAGDEPTTAQNLIFNTLFSFNNTNGAYPAAGLTLGPDGNLYGTTYVGGSSNVGTIFRVGIDGTFTSLLSFTGLKGGVPGAYPAAALTKGLDGNLYGTTLLGGTNGSGTVFQLTTNAGFTSLASFKSLGGTRSVVGVFGDTAATNANGGEPFAPLALAGDGSFYGTTVYGGSNGVGTVFHVTTNGTLISLVSFAGLATNGSPNANGAKPLDSLTFGSNGNLYGLTAYGGSNGVGTVFQVTTNGTLTSLYSFSAGADNANGFLTNADGAEPIENSLTPGPNGNFYGETSTGGTNGSGTIFQVTTNGAFNVVFTFDAQISDAEGDTNTTGASPNELLPGPGGCFYGTASNDGNNGVGTIFSLSTNGIFKLLYSLPPLVGSTNASGVEPTELTYGSDGNLYGTAYAGGAFGYGTVFEVIILPTLQIQFLNGNAVLSWSNSTYSLLSATKATGPYSPVLGGSTSPYTNTVTTGSMFFKLGIVKSL
jgi:uncharacterized repeat protein (TIGR03803 family)